MSVPDISVLSLDGHAPVVSGAGTPGTTHTNAATPTAHGVDRDFTEKELKKLKDRANALPYSIEPHSQMIELLDFIVLRLTQCVEAKDYDVGMTQWDSMLSYWMMLKYPIPKPTRIHLAKLYYELAILPHSTRFTASCADTFKALTRSKTKLTILDLRLSWKPVYEILSKDLFLNRRQFEYTQLTWCMGYLAENARRFYHPNAIDDMLSTFIPQINANNLDSVLATQYYMTTFLPLTHPQSYLPMLFRWWESVNSYQYDERQLSFLAKLAEMHVDPSTSETTKAPDDEITEGEKRPGWSKDSSSEDSRYTWPGLYKDVGIFTEHEWGLIMIKCLASMEIPLADAGSLTTGPNADGQVSFEISRLPKPGWRIASLARIIVYSMAPDGIPAPESTAPTPFMSPTPSGVSTPQIQTHSLREFLSAPLSKAAFNKGKKYYLAGSKALDSLVRLVASTESFFHPANSGAWTSDLSAFIKYIVYDFNRRWHEEQEPDCKTPFNRRLTKAMKRELVKSLRTVTLLAMFSQDSSTVSNIQSCMKSMSVMEPDLILYPVLERAIPSLEALVETQRTMAVIKSLGAVASSMVCRDVYYPGAKHLVEILQLLIPGIDLNDPSKTLCTTAFLVEISQHIKFGDLTEAPPPSDSPGQNTGKDLLRLPSLNTEEVPRLSDAEEDALLRDSTGSFADWISNLIRRVIQLMENLPEEGPDGSAGGTTEVQVVDAVAGACNQICVHLSDSLFDLVLNMVFDYASTTVRSNAVRAIHQLVECVANANAEKTLRKFIPFCVKNIQWELDNGASGVRTTSTSRPAASDATLHWNLAILRGTVYNDGKAVAKFRDELLPLLKLLHEKTLSKRGYSWTGKLLSSLLLTLTHTYPLENKFVNPEEWSSPEFEWNHHKHWGKMYTADQVKISWHVPNQDTIGFALQIFRELVEPTMSILEGLLKPGLTRDAVWRNEFCRHLTLVRNAFAGIPTMLKENPTEEQIQNAAKTSDIIGDIPEMIAAMPSMSSSFCLTDPSDPSYIYISSLKSRFGKFLHDASTTLRVKEGEEENTFDAVYMVIRSVRTFMMDYGDSRDNYFVNEESFNSERNVARQFAGQKQWPRAIFVRQARYYHAARLRWNSTDRYRTPLQDAIIDDIVEWSLWHYPQIREASQSLLETVSNCYDGVRRRALPVLQEALNPGTEDDRMKGALWTLNLGSMGKYAVSEPLLAPELLEKLLKCSHNEKSSIQNCVQTVADNCIANFVEPTYLGYEHPLSPSLVLSVETLKSLVAAKEKTNILERTTTRRIERVQEMNEACTRTISTLLSMGQGKEDNVHWRYRIMMIRLLRTLIRRDKAMSAEHMDFVLRKTHDSNPTVRYYAQRALMKGTRNMKLRTYCQTPFDLYLGRSKNPLKETLNVTSSHANTESFLKAFKEPFDPSTSLFRDKTLRGLVPWDDALIIAHPPHATHPTFEFGAQENASLEVLRGVVCKEQYWKDIKVWFQEETGERVVGQDHISSIKSIYQALGDEPLQYMLPIVESLLASHDSKDSQRAAAELLCGVIGGSKLWSLEKQKKLWDWFDPHMKKVLSVSNIKTDTSGIWTSFLEYVFYCKDPRRLQPLVSHISDLFLNLDFNTEFSFDATKILALYRAFYEELGGKFGAWADETVDKVWNEGSLYCDHEDVRAYSAEILVFTEKIKRRANSSTPHTEVLLKECRILPLDFDIMGMRGTYHLTRIEELAKNFKTWRGERNPGVRAFQSVYDRVGVTVCKWLFQAIHDINAIGYFDYILPLIPELFRFTELNDNSELSRRANILLVRMCGVPPPRSSVHKILDVIFDTIQHSPSWRIKLKALPLLQVFYFRNLPFIPEPTIIRILEVLCNCLDDEHVQVREMASTTLSGVLRLSPRKSVLTYRDRFVRLARTQGEGDSVKRQKHAGILGICALVDSYPYTVERWMPKLLTGVLVEFSYEPAPISTTIRRCAMNFKKTHQDTWHEDLKKFTEEELVSLSTLLTGSSYYA